MRWLLAFALLFAAGCEGKPTRRDGCCKVCTTGKPCGDACIADTDTCHKPSGCACDRAGCCKVCTTGKPCGDACIADTDTCHKTAGCACPK